MQLLTHDLCMVSSNATVKMMECTTNTVRLVGRHGHGTSSEASSSVPTANACSCVASLTSKEYRDNEHLVASASWNKELCLWDLRTNGPPVSTVMLPGKAFSMDVDAAQQRVVVATAGRRNCVVDWRQPTLKQVLDRESSLKFQTRTVRFFPDGRGFALGSVEGRVGVEFLDELGVPSTMKRYAFKCHRVSDTVYPVNCIAFHPRFTSTFCTGGCDGSVVLWDGENKKKVRLLARGRFVFSSPPETIDTDTFLFTIFFHAAYNHSSIPDFDFSGRFQQRWIRNGDCLELHF